MNLSRRHFFLGSLALPAFAATRPRGEQPNVLLVLVDALPAWILGCYGNREVRTPNLDRLAQTGTRFLNHYACAPVADKARATLLTGRTTMQLKDTGEVTLEKLLGGIGYAGGSSLLFTLLIGSLFIWYRTLGSVSVDTVSSPKAEMFYWVTIMFSQTLGTALGDWTADTAGLGYTGGAVVFGSLLAAVAAAYYWTKISRTILFWAAFILTRPLGAVIGDFLDKPLNA